MSDLISRSAYREKLEVAFRTLTKELDEAIRNEDEELILAIRNQQSAYHLALQILDAQPTSYDVDAVIQLVMTDICNLPLSKEELDNLRDNLISSIKDGGIV